ncbi:MAG: PDZ domain-containing protein, partial [Prevotella sp.]|nr:PDZ domain-containing protein [Prevotellaceae bacterium]MDY5343132.1 PDZ domain-containing protein [Prevotella sp.]
AKVVDDGAAADAGVQVGDVIIKADGQKLTKMAELQELMAKKRPGDKLSLTYLHNKKEVTKTITLKNEQGTTKVVQKADLDVLDAAFRPVTEDTKKQMNITYGLEVLKVNKGKLADAGIGRGFIIQKVNDSAIKSIDDLQKAVKDASTSKEPVLYIQGIYPTGKKGYFAVPLQE